MSGYAHGGPGSPQFNNCPLSPEGPARKDRIEQKFQSCCGFKGSRSLLGKGQITVATGLSWLLWRQPYGCCGPRGTTEDWICKNSALSYLLCLRTTKSVMLTPSGLPKDSTCMAFDQHIQASAPEPHLSSLQRKPSMPKTIVLKTTSSENRRTPGGQGPYPHYLWFPRKLQSIFRVSTKWAFAKLNTKGWSAQREKESFHVTS